MATLYSVAENKVFRLVIIGYWLLFWLFNVIDKLISGPTFFWLGKNRFDQFYDYFASIGITNVYVAMAFLLFVSVMELLALVLLVAALIYFLKRDEAQERRLVFYAILVSLIVFTFFAVGDQVFGDRVELLEHSLYWVALLVSWYLYTYFEGHEKHRHRRKV